MERRLDNVEEHVVAIRDAINKSTGGINKQTINMLAGITGILLTAILGILIHLATK
jgi:tetrahydromethanopterin S-methyltransferase subunit G